MSALARATCLVLGHALKAPDCLDTVKTVYPLGGVARQVPVIARKWTCTRCRRVVREDRIEPYADILDDE